MGFVNERRERAQSLISSLRCGMLAIEEAQRLEPIMRKEVLEYAIKNFSGKCSCKKLEGEGECGGEAEFSAPFLSDSLNHCIGRCVRCRNTFAWVEIGHLQIVKRIKALKQIKAENTYTHSGGRKTGGEI